MIVHDALAHRGKAARGETRDGQPQRLQERAQRFHAEEQAHGRENHRGDKDHAHADLRDELRGLHNVGHHMFATTLGHVQAGSSAFAEQTERQRHHDKTETAQQVHHETPHVVGVRQVIEIDDDAGACGGQTRHAVEQGIEVAEVMARQVQRHRRHEREHDPREPGNGERLLAIEPTRIDAQEPQRRSDDKRNADGQQIVRRRSPLSARKSRDERHQQSKAGEENEHAEIMADDPNVVQCEPLPHSASTFASNRANGRVFRCRSTQHDPYQDDKRPQQQQEARQRQQHHAVTQQRRLDDLSDVLVPFAHAGILVQMAAVRYARRGNRHNDDDLGAARLAERPFDALHNKVYTRSYRSTHEQGIIPPFFDHSIKKREEERERYDHGS